MKERLTDIELNKECRFCNPPDQERIIYQSDNFYVMLSLGPLVEGYLLLISKPHIDCCGAFDDKLSSEFHYLKELIKEVLISNYGSCTFFEHGRAGSCIDFEDSSLHCHHAHLHCLPVDLRLNDKVRGALRPVFFEKGEFQNIYRRWNEPYLYIDDGREALHFLTKKPRRQYLRYLVAKQLGNIPKTDWQNHPEWDLIYKAKEKLQDKFKQGELLNY